MDVRELDRYAVLKSIDVVSRAGPGDLDRPTPCAGWNLGALLGHMTAQHHGFAAAARGQGADPAVWRVEPSGPDPVSRYARAAEHVLAAFAEPGVTGREVALPEISADRTFPAERAILFHFVDYLVHGWDVARALDLPYPVDAAVARAALAVALAVPDGPARLVPGAAFRPPVGVPDDAGEFDRVLAALGRPAVWGGSRRR